MTPAPDILVVDASVATKWYLTDETDVDAADRLLQALQSGLVQLVAPNHIRYEVPSSITVASKLKQPRLSETQARQDIATFLSLNIPTADDNALILEAHALSRSSGCAFYDGLYLALSQRFGIPLITADQKLYRLVRHFPGVMWIAAWQPF